MEYKNFWDNHYSKFTDLAPSPFCIFCMDKVLQAGDSLIELGCGNGRDGMELMQVVKKYSGLDSSKQAISTFQKSINEKFGDNSKSQLINGDFSYFEFPNDGITERMAIYSRFSLHSIEYDAQERLLQNLKNIKTDNWICMIEARTIFDELYGVGEKISEHEYITDHYRRFLDPQVFLKRIVDLFNVTYFEISTGFSRYKGDDPCVMRIIFSPKPLIS